MTKLFLVFNHQLTSRQEAEATSSLQVEEIVRLPKNLEKLWADVDPAADFPEKEANKIIRWLKAKSGDGDFVLVQGDFGLTYYVVGWCLQNGRVPVYSTTERRYESVEMPDGSMKNVHRFSHVRFRKYRRHSL